MSCGGDDGSANTNNPSDPDGPDGPGSLKRYGLLSLYNENGVKGIVFTVSDNGRHGLAVSLDQSEEYWMQTSFFPAMTVDPSDGWANFQVIEQIPGWEEIFPAFKWCNDKNKGKKTKWYLPARNELLLLCQTYIADSEAFDKALTDTGGTKMDDEYKYYDYWSSTETIYNGKYYAQTVEWPTGTVDRCNRSFARKIRAIHKF